MRREVEYESGLVPSLVSLLSGSDRTGGTHSGFSWYGRIASPLHLTSVRSHTCSARSSTEIEKKPVSS